HRLPAALDSIVPGHLHSGRIPSFFLEIWAHGTAHLVGCGEHRTVVPAHGAARALSPVRRRRRNRVGRYDDYAHLLHGSKHLPALPARAARVRVIEALTAKQGAENA